MATLEIFADYYQIYVADPAHIEDWSGLLNDQTLDDRVVAMAHTAVFGSGRNMMVPVDVVVHGAKPDLAEIITKADHAVAGAITCASGQLKLAGCTDNLLNAHAIAVAKGPIGFAFLSFDLGTIDPVEGLDGNDHYALHVWPEAQLAPAVVLKRWSCAI